MKYEIESVKPSQVDDSIKTEFNTRNMGDYKKVYVRLKQNADGLYAVDYVTKEKPGEGVYLKGELKSLMTCKMLKPFRSDTVWTIISHPKKRQRKWRRKHWPILQWPS